MRASSRFPQSARLPLRRSGRPPRPTNPFAATFRRLARSAPKINFTRAATAFRKSAELVPPTVNVQPLTQATLAANDSVTDLSVAVEQFQLAENTPGFNPQVKEELRAKVAQRLAEATRNHKTMEATARAIPANPKMETAAEESMFQKFKSKAGKIYSDHSTAIHAAGAILAAAAAVGAYHYRGDIGNYFNPTLAPANLMPANNDAAAAKAAAAANNVVAKAAVALQAAENAQEFTPTVIPKGTYKPLGYKPFVPKKIPLGIGTFHAAKEDVAARELALANYLAAPEQQEYVQQQLQFAPRSAADVVLEGKDEFAAALDQSRRLAADLKVQEAAAAFEAAQARAAELARVADEVAKAQYVEDPQARLAQLAALAVPETDRGALRDLATTALLTTDASALDGAARDAAWANAQLPPAVALPENWRAMQNNAALQDQLRRAQVADRLAAVARAKIGVPQYKPQTPTYSKLDEIVQHRKLFDLMKADPAIQAAAHERAGLGNVVDRRNGVFSEYPPGYAPSEYVPGASRYVPQWTRSGGARRKKRTRRK